MLLLGLIMSSGQLCSSPPRPYTHCGGGSRDLAMTEKPTDDRQRSGTFFVLEDDPPATRPRWFCH